MSAVKCPNCDTMMEMGTVCGQCEYSDVDIHERDTQEIPVVVLLCEADGCTRDADTTIVVRGLKREVCDICAEQHHEQLDMQHNEEHSAINEERMEGIEGV